MHYYLANLETKNILTDKLEIMNIDIEKYANTWYNEDNPSELSKLMGLIGLKDMSKLKFFRGEKDMIKKIIDKADKFRNDKEVIESYDYEAMRDEREKMAFKEGIQEGIEEGIEQGIESTAINMLKLNLDIKTISEITGLTKERIEQLKNN